MPAKKQKLKQHKHFGDNFMLLVLLSSIIIFLVSGFFFVYNKNKPNVKIYTEKDGRLKYAVGGCETSANCVVAGCSKHVCSSDSEIITSCELRSDFPNRQFFECGCINKKCSWFQTF